MRERGEAVGKKMRTIEVRVVSTNAFPVCIVCARALALRSCVCVFVSGGRGCVRKGE